MFWKKIEMNGKSIRRIKTHTGGLREVFVLRAWLYEDYVSNCFVELSQSCKVDFVGRFRTVENFNFNEVRFQFEYCKSHVILLAQHRGLQTWSDKGESLCQFYGPVFHTQNKTVLETKSTVPNQWCEVLVGPKAGNKGFKICPVSH